MRSDFRTLLWATRQTLGRPVDDCFLPDLETVDWPALLQLSLTHGLSPLVARGLQTHPEQNVPAPILSQLNARTREITARNLHLTAELHRLLEHLSAAGIRVLSFKGPTLACRAYQQVGQREFLDLDILVEPSRGDDAWRLLETLGYRPEYALNDWQLRTYFRRSYQLPMFSERRNIRLELHTGLMRKQASWQFEFETLWERKLAVDVCGRSVLALSKNDMLLYLCAHGCKHRWVRLAWIADIAAILDRERDLDWDLLLTRARESRSVKALGLAFALVNHFFPSCDTPACLQGTVNSVLIRRLATSTIDELQSGKRTRMGIANARFSYYVSDRRRDGLRSIVQQWFEPTFAEWNLLSLPRYASLLYWLLRPGRLAAKYCWPDRD